MTEKPRLTLKNKNKFFTSSTLPKKRFEFTDIKFTQKKESRKPSPRPIQNLKKKKKLAVDTIPQLTQKLTKEEYQLILNYLQETYPKCFPFDNNPLPLAVGIHKSLLISDNLPCSKSKIRKFLKKYTRKENYLNNLIAGSSRVDLDGSIKEKITEEEETHAKSIKLEKSEKDKNNSAFSTI